MEIKHLESAAATEVAVEEASVDLPHLPLVLLCQGKTQWTTANSCTHQRNGTARRVRGMHMVTPKCFLHVLNQEMSSLPSPVLPPSFANSSQQLKLPRRSQISTGTSHHVLRCCVDGVCTWLWISIHCNDKESWRWISHRGGGRKRGR